MTTVAGGYNSKEARARAQKQRSKNYNKAETCKQLNRAMVLGASVTGFTSKFAPRVSTAAGALTGAVGLVYLNKDC
jgi:hypothetical protein